MAFEFWRSVTQGQTAAAREILVLVVSQGPSSILSGLTSLGKLIYLFELLLGAATVVFGIIGVFRCFGRDACNLGAALIDEHCSLLNDERRARGEVPSERDAEVTIRLEDGYLRILYRHRCIVTIDKPLGGAQSKGREVWYARDEK
jgi:hypothetical protein